MRDKELSVAFQLSQARVDYIMANPTSFLNVRFNHIPDERCIRVEIYDTKGIFANKEGTALVKQFRKSLEAICTFVDVRRFGNADIKAMFYPQIGDTPLGWYAEGKYYPWGWLGDKSLVVSGNVELLGKIETIRETDPKLGEVGKRLLKNLVQEELGIKKQHKRRRGG